MKMVGLNFLLKEGHRLMIFVAEEEAKDFIQRWEDARLGGWVTEKMFDTAVLGTCIRFRVDAVIGMLISELDPKSAEEAFKALQLKQQQSQPQQKFPWGGGGSGLFRSSN